MKREHEWLMWSGLLSVPLFFMAGCLLGCSIVDSGPRMMQTAVEGAAGTAKLLLAQYSPEQMNVAVGGEVNDPSYQVRLFAGSGVLVDLTMGLNGADLNFDILSSGSGTAIDEKLREEALAIIGRSGLAEDERRTLLVEAVLRWLAGRTEQLPPSSQ